MSEYLNKQDVLEWLDDRRYKSPWIESFRERLESGAFDVDQTEVQRLLAALESDVMRFVDKVQRLRTALRVAIRHWQSYADQERGGELPFIADSHDPDDLEALEFQCSESVLNDQALSTTTEPTGAERVRAEMKSLFEAWNLRGICEDSLESYEQGVMLELVGLCEQFVGINAPEGDRNDA